MAQPRILVSRLNPLSDVILATPIIREACRRYRADTVHVETQSPEPLVNNPHVARLHRSVAHTDYDIIIDLNLAYERRPRTHVIDAYSEAAFGERISDRSTEIAWTEADADTVRAALGVRSLPDAGLTVLHTGRTWGGHVFPDALWDAVSARLGELGHHVVVVGAGDYRPAGTGGGADLRGVFSIPQLACFLSRQRLFVGADAALYQVAGSTDIPIVALFAASLPAYRAPFRHDGHDWRHIGLTPETPCRCGGQEACPISITPPQVIAAVEAVLA